MPHSNISIFVPHYGCPHMCSFCNQRTITGQSDAPSGDDVRNICGSAIEQVKDVSDTEIAFFGGSFTAIEKGYMTELLEAAGEFVGKGKFSGIRISTRPDYIDGEILMMLKKYGVTAIELGAQSMCEQVLEANERGHSAQDVFKASELIKSSGFELGLQMMVGLYKSSEENEYETCRKIIDIKPDTVRIYPVVILEGTRLGELYKSGEYKTFDFDKTVEMCAEFMELFETAGIKVIKVGLHASEIVEGQMLGGFYHPAFRELCQSRIYQRKFKAAMNFKAHENGEITISSAEFSVPSSKISQALGQKKSNVRFFENKGIKLIVKPNNSQQQNMKIIRIDYKKTAKR